MRLLILVITLLFVGCTRSIYVPVVHSRTVVDTVVSVGEDSAMIRALFECDSAGKILIGELTQVKGRLASQAFQFNDNELKVETRWQTKFIERKVEIRDTVTVVDIRKEAISKPFIPKFFWGCFAVSLIVVFWGGWRVIKIFL